MPLLLVAMPFVAMPLLLVAMPFVAMPLLLVAMPFVTSSDALAPSSDALCY